MKVLFVASEATPFAKTGGLADVAGSLPKSLVADGVDIRVIMPKYGLIDEKYRSKMKHVYDGKLNVAWREKYVGLDTLTMDGVTYYFVDNEEYFKRDGFYGYDDDAERFAFFSRAILRILPEMDFWPDVLHLNDWHTSLVSVYLKLEHIGDPRYQKIKTLFTIHNLKYQGVFPKDIMEDTLGIDWKYFNNGDLEFYDAVNLMKGGIIYSDFISTVSKTYAEEIQTPYFGEGLDGLLRSRKDTLFGIINGIDYDCYNPETDANTYKTFDADSFDSKLDNKMELQRELGLPVKRNTPIVAVISRLVPNKGMDLIVRMMDEILRHEDIQFIVLGTGDKVYEDWFKGLQWRFPQKCSVNIRFSEALAQKIYASATIFLMPSDFEPCGIGQLVAMRYGTVPVVRETGGLKDTVQPFDKYSRKGTGFLFHNYNAHEMMYALRRALKHRQDIRTWTKLFASCMKADFSWKKSAKEYDALYKKLVNG